jgi:superoxide dismutase, Fe-Mn family
MFEPKNFDSLLGLDGLSDKALNLHFKLYQGYVNNVNKLNDLLPSTDPASPQYAELKRRFGWEFNGMRLHELFFENLTKNPTKLDAGSTLYSKISQDFGSFENWKKDFEATALIRGVGWVILAYDSVGDRLFNCWVNEHDVGHLCDAKPLAILDVFEHAYLLDYGAGRPDYLKTFFAALDWSTVDKRFSK